MKKIYLIFTALLLLFSGMDAAAQVSIDPDSLDIVQGKIRLKLKHEVLRQVPGVSSLNTGKSASVVTGIRSLDELNRKYGIKRMERVFPFSLKFEARHRKYNLHLWYELDFDEDLDPQALAEEYSLLKEVEIAKPLYKKVLMDGTSDSLIVYVDTVRTQGQRITRKSMYKTEGAAKGLPFDDPYLSKQWHYNNDGTVGTEGVDIDLFNAWTKETGSRQVIVSVVDGGLDIHHEDLKDNLWVNEAEANGEEGVDDDKNGYVDDIHGYNFVFNGALTPHTHGTHVGGTVGAVNNNGIGVCGVAGGDGSGNGVRLMSCQVYDNRGGHGNFAAAIVYGADMGAVISQNSWGYNQPGYYEPEVLDAIRYFIAEAGHYEGSPMKGGVLFFAAGNNGAELVHYPGAFDEVVSVAATGPTGYPAPYSTYGDWVDLSAPGGDQAYYGEEGGVLSTFPDDQYGFYQGTSMATPHVSGVAALAVARFGGDNFTAESLKKLIIASTTPFIFDSQGKYGSGNLNAVLALSKNEYIPPDPITDLTATEIFHNEVRLQWTVPADEDDFQPAMFLLAISTSEITAQNFNQKHIFGIRNDYEAGTQINLTIRGLLKETDYWFAIKSADRYQNISEISNILHIKTTKEPHFSESTRNVEFVIDVTQNPYRHYKMTFRNTGEGVVYWNSFTVNEHPWWIPLEEWEAQRKAAVEESKAAVTTLKSTVVTPEIHELTEEEKGDGMLPDYLLHKDNTLYKDFYTYVTSYPTDAVGSKNYHAGLIYITKFTPYRAAFNLTHLELGLLVQAKGEPFYIEIRKGADYFEEARPVLVQKFYADTAEVVNFQRVPLIKPVHFEQNENIWVILYFSKKEPYPLLVHRGPYYPNTFYMSMDNGITYSEAWKEVGNQIPFVGVASTGDDGSYVFLDPTEGELWAGQSQDVDLIVDATQLANGHHLATVGVNTSDINKPGVSVEVKVTVNGQEAAAEFRDLYKYEVRAHRENELQLSVKNTGLDSLYIYDIVRDEDGVSVRAFDDTLAAAVNGTVEIPFLVTPSSTGLLHLYYRVITSIGEFRVPTEMQSTIPPEISVSVDKAEVTLPADQTADLTVTIANTGTGNTLLHYTLEDYNIARILNGFIGEKLQYRLRSSDDATDPVTSEWTDITDVATEHYELHLPYWRLTKKLESGFPFFDVRFDEFYYATSGCVFTFNLGYIDTQEEASENYRASGYIFPFYGNLSTRTVEYYYYSLGDRYIFTVTLFLSRGNPDGTISKYGNITYQMVLFRDGTIEYHYQDVDLLEKIDSLDYAVGIQGMKYGDYVLYKDFGDTLHKIHNGLVVRFEPENQISFLTTAAVSRGTVAQGDSVQVILKVDPSVHSMPAGTYTNHITVRSDAGTPAPSLPVTIHVTGVPLATTADTLDFGQLHKGFPDEKPLKIDNTGTEVVQITTVTFSDTAFALRDTLPQQVEAEASLLLPVIFSPAATGPVSTTMTVTFDNGTSRTVRLLAEVMADPTYTLNIGPDIVREVTGGEVVRVPFTLTTDNTGEELEVMFTGNSVFASAEAPDILNGEGAKGSVGEEYGYAWKVTDSLRVFYKWKDIKKEGATPYDISFEEQKALKLPFRFPFYGGMYDSIWISKNGYVTVIRPEGDGFTGEFETGDGIRGMIAPFYSNLMPDSPDNHVWVRTEEDRVYILWDGFRGEDVSSSGGNVYFQLEMVADGSIFFHYRSVNQFTHVLNYGLESPDESETFETYHSWLLSWGMVDDSTTIAIYPPLRDHLAAGATHSFNLLLSGKYIYRPGTYHDTVVLMTNSMSAPEQRIPVTLHVTGTPSVSAPDTIAWDEVIYTPEKKVRKKFILNNTGYDAAHVTRVTGSGFYEYRLYDEAGNEIRKTSTGTLFNPIEIRPWDRIPIYLEIIIHENSPVEASLIFSGNFTPDTTHVTARVVDSPVFSWDAADQHYRVVNTDKPSYAFTMHNEGVTPLRYNLIPAVMPADEGGETPPPEVDEIGYYEFEQPTTVDSMAVESKEKADGYETPLIEVLLAFANEFTAPEGGFYLTHVKVNGNFKAMDEYISIRVYKGGDEPMQGELVYKQEFITYRYVLDQWVYFPLAFPLRFEEGEKFYIVVMPPMASKYLGYDIAPNEQVASTSWCANYRSWSEEKPWNWAQYNYMLRLYKIRALTAAGEGLWIELDNLQGVLHEGESVTVTATADPVLAGKGNHKAIIRASTNDVDHTVNEFNITMDVNGSPSFIYRPNMYDDTVRTTETETLVMNYVFEDPEGEKMTLTLDDHDQSLHPLLEQTGPETAQLTLRTDYESAGVYHYAVTLTDSAGNEVHDEILLKVEDKNRPPVLNPDYSFIRLNMAGAEGGLLTIDPAELFSDPDDDELTVLAGNYTPDMLDMALGYRYIDLHPLQTGIGFVVFGADDGKENGFVVYGIYVQIIDDATRTGTGTDGSPIEVEQLLGDGEMITVYPNPVTTGNANILYKLEERADISFDLYDMRGVKRRSMKAGLQEEGIYSRSLDMSNLPAGMYICKLRADGKVLYTVNIMVR